MPTIAEAIAEGTQRLEAGVDEARRAASTLLCHALRIDRTKLLTSTDLPISEGDYGDYLRLIDRRAAGEPLQYITGHQEFYGLDFKVAPGVLIPRPETEFLVERALELIKESKEDKPLVADVGTGSGCIAVAIAAHAPGARLIATDISRSAIEIARLNAERNGVADRIEFLAGDLLAPLAERKLESSIDLLASNPPYVNESQPNLVQREVREWEPHEALFGGADGLDFYRRLFDEAPAYVKAGGHMVIEIGFSQLDAITRLIDASGLQLVDITRDLQGIPRTLTLRNQSEER